MESGATGQSGRIVQKAAGMGLEYECATAIIQFRCFVEVIVPEKVTKLFYVPISPVQVCNRVFNCGSRGRVTFCIQICIFSLQNNR